MFVCFGAHGKLGVGQGSEREGFVKDHGQAKSRDILVPPWTTCLINCLPQAVRVLCAYGLEHTAGGLHETAMDGRAGYLQCVH